MCRYPGRRGHPIQHARCHGFLGVLLRVGNPRTWCGAFLMPSWELPSVCSLRYLVCSLCSVDFVGVLHVIRLPERGVACAELWTSIYDCVLYFFGFYLFCDSFALCLVCFVCSLFCLFYTCFVLCILYFVCSIFVLFYVNFFCYVPTCGLRSMCSVFVCSMCSMFVLFYVLYIWLVLCVPAYTVLCC